MSLYWCIEDEAERGRGWTRIAADWRRSRIRVDSRSDPRSSADIRDISRAIPELRACAMFHRTPRGHDSAAFYGAPGRGVGAGGVGAGAWAFAAGECGGSSKRNHKSCILLWMGGGPPTIDMWDMKPGATTGGRVQADRHGGRRADQRAAAAGRQADEAPVDRAVDEHPRGRSHPRHVLPAHGVRAEPQRGASGLRLGRGPRAARADGGARDSAVRVDRRGERGAGVPGDGVRAVPGRLERPGARPARRRPTRRG